MHQTIIPTTYNRGRYLGLLSGHEQHDKSIWWLVIEKQLKYTFLFQNNKLKKIKYLIEYRIYVNIFTYLTKIHKKLVMGYIKLVTGHEKLIKN
jgi:hypothetical protein